MTEVTDADIEDYIFAKSDEWYLEDYLAMILAVVIFLWWLCVYAALVAGVDSSGTAILLKRVEPATTVN